MEELKQKVLKSWLEIDYYAIANKAKFMKKRVNVNHTLILNTIRCLDHASTMEKEKSRNYVITVIALMWEHTNREEYNLKNFIIKILSRIGYPTSAIIIDEDFDKRECKFFKPMSVFDKLTLTLEQSYNEITIGNRKFLLTEFQKEIWEKMDCAKVIGISAPTSAGKSFVLLIKTVLKMIENNFDIVYIVPTLSLLNQVTEDYNKMLKSLNIKNYRITNSFDENTVEDLNYLYVLTQEKALAAFSNEKKAFNKRMILVVDEIQNIERIIDESDLRAKILFDTLIEFKHKKNVEQIVICGPRIEDIDKLGKEIFGMEVDAIHTSISPVLNLTYSIKKINKKYYFRQYCSLSEDIYERAIEDESIIKAYGQSQYSDEYLEYLKEFIINIGENEQNIIFAPTSNTACKIACSFINRNKREVISSNLETLISYYEDTINKNYAMCSVLKGSVAYHHGKLPMHVRRTLEKAISQKMIKNVVCTTTLMQGVNMPAQNVIIRNPHLYVRKRKDSRELTSYEMTNLRGRSGRLLKDFIGRTYVLDESGFEDIEGYNQMELFEEVSAELPSGYGEKFEEYKDDIIDVIEGTKAVDIGMERYGYLVSYIRQSVLRYGKSAQKRMNEVGINLTRAQVAAIIKKIEKLTVPKEICYKNRYWDPFVLEDIYNRFNGQMPDMPNKRGAKARINELMKFLRDSDTTKMMYEKYIPKQYQKGARRTMLCNYCIDWACETPLSEILEGDRYEGEDGSENIDETIDLLERIVSFNVPLLLKPIFDMFKPNSPFLNCIQTGSFKKYTGRMIEIGVPRETAIFLNEHLFKNIKLNNNDDERIEDEIRRILNDKFDDLPYWIQVQLEFMR